MSVDPASGPFIYLATSTGSAAVRHGAVVAVSAPFLKMGQPVSRVVMLDHGHKVYCLNSPENFAALGVADLSHEQPGVAVPVTKPARRRRKAGPQA